MHSPDRFFRQPQSSKGGSRGYSSHLSWFYVLTALWASVRLGTPSRPCGLKNDLLCSRPVWACSHLENRELSHFCHCPLCQVGCVAFPEDFTCPVSLGDTGQFNWTSRSLHSSCHTGQARSTGLSEILSLSVECLALGWEVSL